MTGVTHTLGCPQWDALLATKLYIPSLRPGLVARPRLLERLDRGLSVRLILVSAPAGAGKTTLLSEWLSRCPCPSAWVSLDAGDNAPVRFFDYVVAAVDSVAPGSGETVRELLAQPQPPPLQAVLTQWLNGLCALGGNLVLVLDDYHVIAADAIHAALAFLVENAPPQLHLAISTRADPPLPLARLRSRGQLLEVRGDDLRFSSEEAALFLNQAMGLGLAADDVAALEARTEGWIAGLQLAALSMQGCGDVTAFVQAFSGSHRYVLDYLVEEVLERQPAEVQAFLLHTCILERLTAPLCESLTGEAGAQAMLEGLERRNLFLVALDDERRWYRYHHLFCGLLRARLEQQQAGLVRGLHRNAADWYEANGLPEEAVSHALAAGDVPRAARLIEDSALIVRGRSHVVTIYDWLAELPREVLRSRPWLSLRYAEALADMGRAEGVEALLADAEAQVRANDDSPATRYMVGYNATVRAALAYIQRDAAGIMEQSRRALANQNEAGPTFVPGMVYVQGEAHLLEGDLEGAAQAFAEAGRLGNEAGQPVGPGGLCRLAWVRRVQGRLRQAAEAARQAMAIREASGCRFLVPGADVAMAGLLCEWNELEAAKALAMVGVEDNRAVGQPAVQVRGHLALSHVLYARGDLANAAHELEQAQRYVAQHVAACDAQDALDSWQMQLWLARGDLTAAAAWAEQQRLAADDALSFRREAQHIAFARLLLARGQPGKAAGLLARLAEAAGAGARTGRLIEILLLEAQALRVLGENACALDTLAQALALAEPEGYVRTFLDEGPPVLEMLRELMELRELGELRVYTGRLLAAAGLQTRSSAPSVSAAPPVPLPEPLSVRELEVLRLAQAGLSNREIAERLVVTVGTVKTHLHNVYAKLDARTRTHALARARELGLL